MQDNMKLFSEKGQRAFIRVGACFRINMVNKSISDEWLLWSISNVRGVSFIFLPVYL